MEPCKPSDGCKACRIKYANNDEKAEHELSHLQGRQRRGSVGPESAGPAITAPNTPSRGEPSAYDGTSEVFTGNPPRANVAPTSSKQRTSGIDNVQTPSASPDHSSSDSGSPTPHQAAPGDLTANLPETSNDTSGTSTNLPMVPYLPRSKSASADWDTPSTPSTIASFATCPESPGSPVQVPIAKVTQALRDLESAPGSIAAIELYQDNHQLQMLNQWVKYYKSDHRDHGPRVFSRQNWRRSPKQGLTVEQLYKKYGSEKTLGDSVDSSVEETTASSVPKEVTNAEQPVAGATSSPKVTTPDHATVQGLIDEQLALMLAEKEEKQDSSARQSALDEQHKQAPQREARSRLLQGLMLLASGDELPEERSRRILPKEQQTDVQGCQPLKANPETTKQPESEQNRDETARQGRTPETQNPNMDHGKPSRKKKARRMTFIHQESIVDFEGNDETRKALDSAWEPLTVHSKQASDSSRPGEPANHDSSAFEEGGPLI